MTTSGLEAVARYGGGVKRRTPPWWFGVAILLLGAGLWLIARELGTGDATAADWLGALATLAGFMAALLAAWYLARAYDIEQKRESDRDDQERRGQAEIVVAWGDGCSIETGFHPEPGHEGETVPLVTEMHATLWNASFGPIYDVRIDLSLVQLDAQGSHGDLEVVAGGPVGVVRFAMIPPSYKTGTDILLDESSGELPLYLLDPIDTNKLYVQMALTFRDAGNRVWHRGVDGYLELLRDTLG